MSARSANCSPIHTASYRGGRVRVAALWAVMVVPVSRYTSSARRIRFSSDGWSRAADSGSTRASSASSGAMPSRHSCRSSSSRTAPPLRPGAKSSPRTRASAQSPVPPTTMGSRPLAKMSSTTGTAVWTYRAADHCSDGSATAIIWWGTPPISSAVGAAVPTLIPR